VSTDYPSAAVAGVPRTETVVAPAVEVEVGAPGWRDHVRWGPIIAGVVTGFAVLLLLTVIGVALGLSALGTDDDARSWGTAAGIWGGLTLLVAFFVGGWMAARASSPAYDPDGVLNGFVTGAATLLLLLWLATTAITGALGFFAGTIADIAGAAAPAAAVATQTGAPQAAQQAENAVNQAGEQIEAAAPDNPQEAAAAATEVAKERVAPGAWGTAIAMVLAVGAATVGGMVGQNQRRTLTGRTVVATR
jgi:hypothetical protein